MLSGILAFTVTLLIHAEFNDSRKRIYVLKPLSTLLVISIAAEAFFHTPVSTVYAGGVCLGLLFSLAGDCALMFKSRTMFTAGLVLFLGAHIVYAVLFTLCSGFQRADLLTGSVLAAIAVLFYRFLYSSLGRLRVPVLFYVVIICFMMNRAVSTLFGDYFSSRQALFITIGASLFFISDIILAVSRFKIAWRYNRISLAFYYSGQLLIALSASVI
jgi:uncharacterized membrane protein YhhN